MRQPAWNTFFVDMLSEEDGAYLVERIDRGSEFALLAYIKEKAVFIDPALDPYFEKYGV